MDKEYYNKLNDLLKKTRYNSNIDNINREYQELCSKFSPAYLAGSHWYVGPNLKDGKLFDKNIYNMMIFQGFFK